MFGLGMGEIVIILVLALILLGPQKLPDAAKQIGKGLREFRKATEDLKSQFEGELYADDAKAAAKPTLVETPKPGGAVAATPPDATTAPAPAARADNVPGLDAALAEGPPPAALAPAVPAAALAESQVTSETAPAAVPKAS